MKRGSSTRQRMVIAFISLITISYVLLTLVANYIFKGAIIAQAWRDVGTSTQLVSSQIQKHFEAVSVCAKTIVRDLNYSEKAVS